MLEAPKTQRDGKDRKLHNTHGANPRGTQAVKAMNQSCPCRRSQHEARLGASRTPIQPESPTAEIVAKSGAHGIFKPADLMHRFKRFGRCFPLRFCRVRGAMGKKKGRLRTRSSITGDMLANRYLPQIYGCGHYPVPDDVASLPARLPEIYLRLRY